MTNISAIMTETAVPLGPFRFRQSFQSALPIFGSPCHPVVRQE